VKFADQFLSIFGIHTEVLTSVQPYLEREMPDGYHQLLEYMEKVGNSRLMSCCQHHRRQSLMGIWCAGATTTIQLYQMYGESEDLGKLLSTIQPIEGHHE
jgi:hypothetical protein